MDVDVKKITPGIGKMERKDYLKVLRDKGKVNKYQIECVNNYNLWSIRNPIELEVR